MIDLPPRPRSMREAACRGQDTDRIFYPSRGERLAEAKAFCARCAVREERLEYALGRGEKVGVWGDSVSSSAGGSGREKENVTMSENTQEHGEAEPTDKGQEKEQQQKGPFDAAYVARLRAEAAENRTTARDAKALAVFRAERVLAVELEKAASGVFGRP